VPADTAGERQQRQQQWPTWLGAAQQLAYLKEVHGIVMAPRTLSNRITAGTGPKCKYFGIRRLSKPEWLDEWVEAQLRDTPWDRRRKQDKDAALLEAPQGADR
jgi:hypothetical protein